MTENQNSSRRLNRTPTLKRNIFQHLQLKSHPIKSNQPYDKLRQKVTFLEKIESSTISSECNIFQKSRQEYQFSNGQPIDVLLTEGIIQINDLFQATVSEDVERSVKLRQKKSYNHHYDEVQSFGQVEIGEIAYIPQIVQQKYENLQQQSQKSTEGKRNINFIQGFLPQIGFLYYFVQNEIFFFEAGRVSESSKPSQEIVFQNEKDMQYLYNIQILNVGKPFFKEKKSVMIFIHPYRAQIYEYNVITNHDNKGEKHINIQIKKPYSSFNLPMNRPNRLAACNEGTIYCTDQHGNLFKIDSSYSYNKKSLSMSKIKQLWFFWSQGVKKFSFINTLSSIKRYTKNLFIKKSSQCQIVIDSSQRIALVLLKKKKVEGIQLEKKKTSSSQQEQYLLIYDIESLVLLYTIIEDQLFNNHAEEIINCISIHPKLYSDFNFAFLLQSGKRIYAQINRTNLVKKRHFRQPPLQEKDRHQENNQTNINSFIFESSFLAILAKPNKRKIVLATEGSSTSEKVVRVTLNEKYNKEEDNASEFYLYAKKGNYIGYKKQSLIESEEASMRSQDMYSLVQQVFYRPLELYYANDYLLQKIKILRPIDVFFTLFVNYRDNISMFFKYLKLVMPHNTAQELISFCCQIYTDDEGLYYESKIIIEKVQRRQKRGLLINDKLKSLSGNKDYQEHKYLNICKEHRQRLITVIKDIAYQSKENREESDLIVIKGIFKYYCKIMRLLWTTSINDLSSETCKTALLYLKDLSKMIQDLKPHFFSSKSNESIFKITQRWADKFKQLLMLVRSVPNLPQISMHEALTSTPETFHSHLFYYMVKQCNMALYSQLSKVIPYYASKDFTKIYKIYCEIQRLSQPEQILKICRQYKDLPQYFIDYLVFVKKIPEANLLTTRNMIFPLVRQFNEEDSIETKIQNILRSNESNLYLKEIQLFHVENTLKTSLKEQEITLQVYTNYLQKINDIKSRITIQNLIIQAYKKQFSPSSWKIILKNMKKRLKIFEKKDEDEQNETLMLLSNNLLGQEELKDLIGQMGDRFIEIIFIYYYNHSQFMHRLQSFLDKESQQAPDFHSYSQKRKQQLYKFHHLIHISLEKQQLRHVLNAYMKSLTNSHNLESIKMPKDIISKPELCWLYFYCADIGMNIQDLYQIGVNNLSSADSPERQTYIAVSCYNLVREFLPDKKQELIKELKINEGDDVMNEVYALILS